MSKAFDKVREFRGFLLEVRNELRKSSWPLRAELVESTMVVIISVVLFALFVAVSDKILMNLVRWVIR